MKRTEFCLPHPVLGNGDDVYPLLGRDCIAADKPVKAGRKTVFRFRLKQRNKEILNLIKKGKAVYTCEVYCSRTFLRDCIVSSKPEFCIELPSRSVVGKVMFNFFVVAKEDIHGYRNGQFNPDYEDAVFNLQRGDILVLFPSSVYFFDLSYDRLYSAGSFMEIASSESDDRMVWYNLSGDKIIIMLPPMMYRKYQEVRGTSRLWKEAVFSSIVMQGLVFALYNINDPLYEGKLWADAIRYRLETDSALKGFSLEDFGRICELAQVLLGNPYKRLFECGENTGSLFEF